MSLKINRSDKTRDIGVVWGMHSSGYGQIANGNSLKHIFLRAFDAALYGSALWPLRITFALGLLEICFFFFHRNWSLQQFFL